MRQWFEDPGVPIPPAISALTGISDADVAGQRIDEHEPPGSSPDATSSSRTTPPSMHRASSSGSP
jgi:hypothetical protein